ncbi:tyrosine-type recombinase/integrase [Streptomyces sp. NBC_01500]|uniref:tyrosine-type recombinase/integrase n=1 Tax=Streptomyces sp. NBC_01500 TaxID=2903886 RepID=UPI00225A6850|nr:tyrosine-type recombinase/integrase [Streptomyces sp. NBC_01500]MCX4547520.1 tyrosine-type recombinase/integrase [Streptomyces sp. NBC_01500]
MSEKVVTLPDIPGAGEELEDYIAALFQASGHFVEKQIVESDPADLLELDIVTTDYTGEEAVRRLTEVKGGKWGYTDLFKVVDWMQYLKIQQGAFFHTRWDDRETAPGRMKPLGLDVVCFDDFETAPEHFEEMGFGAFIEPKLIGLWRHSYCVERRLVKLINERAKKGEEGAKAAKTYHRQINNGTFFARAPEESLAMLYEAYGEHPRLTLGYAQELDGGTFDPQTPPAISTSYQAMFRGKYPELQACAYFEHRARLSILKAAVDYGLAHPEGPPEFGMSEDGKSFSFQGLTYHALPATFHSGMSWLREQPNFRLYATFWQQLLWAWGGFYLDDAVGISSTGMPEIFDIQSNSFSSRLIKPLEPDAKGRRWEKSRDVMMHALRHLYASMMINGGVDVYTLADRLGHADPAFTLRKYVHRVVGAGSKVRIAVRSAYTRAA